MSYTKFSLFCATESAWKTVWSTSAPATCPTNAGHTIRADSVHIVNANSGPLNKWYPIYSTTAVVARQVVSFANNNMDSGVCAGMSLPTATMFASSPLSTTASVQLADNVFVIVYIEYTTIIRAVAYSLSGTVPVVNAASIIGDAAVDGYLSVAKVSATEFAVFTLDYNVGPCVYFATVSGGIFLASSVSGFASGFAGYGAPGTLGIAYNDGTQLVAAFPVLAASSPEIVTTQQRFVPFNIVAGSPRTIAVAPGSTTLKLGVRGDLTTDVAGLPGGYVVAPFDATHFVYCGELNFVNEYGVQIIVCFRNPATTWVTRATFDLEHVERTRDMTIARLSATRYVIVYRQTISASDTYGRAAIFDVSAVDYAITVQQSVQVGGYSGFQSPSLSWNGATSFMIANFNTTTGAVQAGVYVISGDSIVPKTGIVVVNKFAQAPTACFVTGSYYAIAFVASRYDSHGSMYIAENSSYSVLTMLGAYRGRRAIGVAGNSATGDGSDRVACRVVNRGIVGGFVGLQVGRAYFATGSDAGMGLVPIAATDAYEPQAIGIAVSATELDVRM